MTRSTLEPIFEKVRHGIRLTEADALALFQSEDLPSIGRIADWLNHQKNGRNVFFNLNRHINPTNICALSCKFCAFSRKPGEEGAYAYTLDEIIAKAKLAVEQGATEIHMVGGLHPRWSFSTYVNIIKSVKTAFPTLHIKAFTAVELDWMARRDRRTVRNILEDLVAAGLGSLPGGGAEIFHPEIRAEICDTKVDAEAWLETHRIAHGMGLQSNCTMLYGHIEEFRHRVDHMARLRTLQDETGGFSAFIPLAFQPDDNAIGKTRYTHGFDDLKTIAVARLFLDNFKHIKAYWIMLGQDIAQLALSFGANDLDGTVAEEKISRMAGGQSGVVLTRSELEGLIAEAGSHGVERDTLYRPITALAEPPIYPTGHRPLFETAYEARSCPPTGHASFCYSVRFSNWDQIESPSQAGSRLRAINDIAVALDSEVRPSTLVWDLTAGSFLASRPNLPSVVACLDAASAAYPELTQIARGFDALMTWSAEQTVPLHHILTMLRRAGLTAIEADAFDHVPLAGRVDTALLRRHIDLHALCHTTDIRTIARLPIAVGDSADDVKALAGCYAARHESSPGFLALQVVGPEALSPTPYLQAVAWVRSQLGSIENLISPLNEFSSFRARTYIGPFERSPLLKVAPLALHFGANDLGHFYHGRGNPMILAEETRASGFSPYLRDGAFRREPVMIQDMAETNSTRHHVPFRITLAATD